MEGQGDHRLHLGQVYQNHIVIIRALRRIQGFILLPTSQGGHVRLGDLVGTPDRGQAGSLSGHHVDAAAVVHGQGGHAGAEKFHDGIFHDALGEGSTDERQRHILGAYAGTGHAGEIDGDDLGIGDVIGLVQQLLDQLRPALAHGDGAKGAISGVTVRTQEHLTAAGVAFSHVGVDDRLMSGDELAAVLLGGGQAKHMVVLIDGTAYGAEAVVAVGEDVGQRELPEAAGAGGLDDAHIGDVVGGHGIELDLQVGHVAAGVVAFQDAIGHSALLGLRRSGHPLCRCGQEGAVFIVCRMVQNL